MEKVQMGSPRYGISKPFGNHSVLWIFSCLTKPEKLLSFWHCGMYTEQDKEIELTFMESLPCVGMYWGLLNGILLIIRAIL